jgi:hypothetical protein
MNIAVVQRILGLLLMLFSLTMLPPVGRVVSVRRRQLAAVHRRVHDRVRVRVRDLVAEPQRTPRAAPA